MHAFRLIPALVLFFLVQLGLHRVLCSIFLFRADQARARRWLGWLMGAATMMLPVQFAAIHAGAQITAPLRWSLVEPLLGWLLFGLPLLLSLVAARALARRWPRRQAAPGAAARDSLSAAPQGLIEPAAVLRPDRLGPAEAAAAPESEPAPLAAPLAPDVLSPRRRAFLARSAQLLLGGTALAVGRGVREAEQVPQVSRVEIPLRNLHPDLDGLTVLQLSDIHSGALITEERMREFAAAAAALQADLIVFTGDLLDGSARASGPYTRAFESLHGKLGTFAILGNHDYYAGEHAAIRALRDAGQTLLRNSGQRVVRGRGSLWLGGVDDPLIRDAGGEVDPVRALAGAYPEEARILLAHRPGLFELCAAAGAQLVLSGHTHGGQLALSPTLSAARLIGKHTYGRYDEDGAQLYVHRGMGIVGAAPVRLGVPPELALLTLRRV